VSAASGDVGEDLRRWWSAQEGVRIDAAHPAPQLAGRSTAERLGDARVDSAVAVISGERL